MAYVNEKGQEVLSDVPMAIPVGFERPLTLQEQIRRLMRVEYDRMAMAGVDPNDMETPEEADDFDVDDDFDPSSPFEDGFMPDDVPAEPITSDQNFNPNADKVTSEEAPQEQVSEASSA